jgi:hypothetical protein
VNTQHGRRLSVAGGGRPAHPTTSIKETTMTETTTPPAALSVGRLARALHEADAATSPGDHPAWDQLTAEAVARFRTMAGLVIERLGSGAGGDRDAILRWAADQIDAETRQAKAHGVLEPDKFRPCRDASAQLRALAGCQECASGLEHDTHCPYPESHNWGCGCPSDERPTP